jgi:putative cell wall-binding protein
MSSSEVGVVPDVTKPAITKAELALDREARLMRYREKRKNRRFEKTIRYASRKAYAETRPRIKGRFAKRTDTEPEVEQFDRVFDFMIDNGYGVVPTF